MTEDAEEEVLRIVISFGSTVAALVKEIFKSERMKV